LKGAYLNQDVAHSKMNELTLSFFWRLFRPLSRKLKFILPAKYYLLYLFDTLGGASETMKRFIRYSTLILLTVFIQAVSIGQQLTVNTPQMETLIERWNALHNSINHTGFDHVYDDELWYYAERAPRAKATLLKKLLFLRNPSYTQKISSSVKYTLHKTGIVKCDFTIDTWKKSAWESTPMYLLVGYKKHGYCIIGEGNNETDKQFGFTPKIGDPVDVEILSGKIDDLPVDLPAKTDLNSTLSLKEAAPSSNLPLFLIIALIGGGVLIIAFKNSKVIKGRIAFRTAEEIAFEDDGEIAENGTELPNQVYHQIEHNLKQEAFKAYLIKLFDPLSFKYEITRQPEMTNLFGSTASDHCKLRFQFVSENSEPSTFIVHYIYTEDTGQEIQLLSVDDLSRINLDDQGINLYFIIAIGGPPHCPDDLYLIPARDLKSAKLSKENLQPFKKTGMFFFNKSTNRVI
jgi:hypothetical protein